MALFSEDEKPKGLKEPIAADVKSEVASNTDYSPLKISAEFNPIR